MPYRRPARHLLAACALTLVATACGSDSKAASHTPMLTSNAVAVRLEALQSGLAQWRSATTLAQAKAGAESVSNLVTGPDVSVYGDLDGDGSVAGASTVGLLPGAAGQPGLTLPPSACVTKDVLGGSWSDAGGRWHDLRTRIAAWTPTNNTFPRLQSHPQRIVGWATLTLHTASLDDAHEYASHAQLHLDVTKAALTTCSG